MNNITLILLFILPFNMKGQSIDLFIESETQKDSVIIINASIKNNSDTKFKAYKFNEFSTINPIVYWKVSILYEDSVEAYLEEPLINFSFKRLFDKSSFINLKPNEFYNYCFKINLSKLKIENRSEHPPYSGSYKIQLIYHEVNDDKDIATSNPIFFNYPFSLLKN